ncbi:phosphoenolpyruvate carboxykinase [Kamptonema formosum]|uniref:phosphoenolpyruvate carboxykinase n=1 Tax=Kamptonema formosum TaxID=331992 RepID=UPI0003481D01|nr:phosphoenolpyruvate carboxykinase [Oscillatoria sp. PCC 10802]
MTQSNYGLDRHGIVHTGNLYWNLSTPALYEEAARRREGFISHLGPLVVRTGQYTGRSPNDKFIVREPESEGEIWWGKVNQSFEAQRFESLYARMLAYLQGRDLFIQDCYAGADPNYRISVRVITESAWHNLFAHNMFIQPPHEDLAGFVPDFTIINVPNFHAVPELDSTRSEACVIVNFARRLILIGGTSYAGEIKKSVFTILNYLLPHKHVLSMHCSANIGPDGDTAIFFGLSGTGKTTLSADPHRTLIGDDEHGWSDEGIFNFEGGCYAKVIRLSATAEPEIYATTRRFGTVLENVAIDPLTRRLNLDDESLTENTRAAYPLSHIPNASHTGVGNHPKNVIFLTADAFGVMPPIALLNKEQAMYHFLSGYTAKVAGTERGMGSEPQATFSACFGAPFMALHPSVYAGLLGERVANQNAKVWLVNTGWTGGPYGVGHRMSIQYTRTLLNAVLNGALDGVSMSQDPIFGFMVPDSCPDVPSEVLKPRLTWSDPAAYDAQAKKLAEMFISNFQQFTDAVDASVMAGGPRIAVPA